MQTSWENSAQWYNKNVGEKGHYYHQNVILPGALKLLKLAPGDKILDLACGQGILSRSIPQNVDYLGVDAAPTLIKEAQKKSTHLFRTHDVTLPLSLEYESFSHAAIIMALQNIENPEAVIKNAQLHLKKNGKFLIVLNHPCFRIPRQSSWGVDAAKRIQYRRVDQYLSPLKIPIQTHPGLGDKSPQTVSFHRPLSEYSRYLNRNGFAIHIMEEWVSDKKSEGGNARMENKSRNEFPLFLAILAVKIDS